MKIKLPFYLFLSAMLTLTSNAARLAKPSMELETEQLNTAFQLGSMIPVKPLIKSRSKVQFNAARAALAEAAVGLDRLTE